MGAGEPIDPPDPDASPTVAESPAARREPVDDGQPVHEAPTSPPASGPDRSGAGAAGHAGAGKGAGAGAGSGPSPGLTARSTVSSSAEALDRDEIARTRQVALVGGTLPIAVAAASPWLGGDAVARAVLLAGMGVLLLANLVLLWLARDPARYRRQHASIAWILGALSYQAAVYYFGPLSGAIAAGIIGLYFISLGLSRAVAIAIYLILAVGNLVLVVLGVSGLVADRGLLSAEGLTPAVRLLCAGLLQGVMLAAFLLARASRATTQRVVDELAVAVRAIGQREAILLEVRQDLERAVRIGGPGRFTDQQLGSFKLGHLLGRGAMGEVYEAQHVATAAPAAVKLLQLAAASDRGAVLRFEREARIVAALRSPHVVTVLEVADASAPLPYIAMERLHGIDLGTLLRKRGRLPVAEVVTIVGQLAEGLAAAEAAGVVHRDLKPQNVFRAEVDGSVVWKLLDFGVSRLVDHGATLTHGHVVGTPQYMAPEQAEGGVVDHRTDVYGLAAVAFRCLTGRPPFYGQELAQVLYAVVHQAAPAPSSLVDLPAAIDVVVLAGLAKDPSGRPANARAFATALRAAAGAGAGRPT